MYAFLCTELWNSQVWWLGNLSWDKLISQVLVFEFSYFNPLWKPSFCYTNYFREGVFRIRINGQLQDTSRSILFRHSFVLSYWESQAQVRHNKYVLKETTLRALLFSSGNSGSQGLFWLAGPLKHSACQSWFIPTPPYLKSSLSKLRSQADETEPTASLYTASGGASIEVHWWLFRKILIFICCWAFKIQLRKNRARMVAGY